LRVIRVWPGDTENQILDIDTNTGSPVTALASNLGSSTTFVASFASGDGIVKVFARRLKTTLQCDHIVMNAVRGFKVRVGTQLGERDSSLSASEVMLWDLREADRPPKHRISTMSCPLSVFARCSTVTASNWRTQTFLTPPPTTLLKTRLFHHKHFPNSKHSLYPPNYKNACIPKVL